MCNDCNALPLSICTLHIILYNEYNLTYNNTNIAMVYHTIQNALALGCGFHDYLSFIYWLTFLLFEKPVTISVI